MTPAFDRILVATDFGDAARRALDVASTVAAATGAKVTLLHVYDLPMAGLPDGAIVVSPEHAERIATAARTSLAAAAEGRADKSVAVETMLRHAQPVDGILATAESIDADLIVVGTHGRTGLSRALMGSVAEEVVRASKRPVLTVRASAPPAHA